jgi:hypothetical protein
MHPDGVASNDDVAVKVHIDPQQDARVQREIAMMERLTPPLPVESARASHAAGRRETIRIIIWQIIEGEP